MRMAMPEMNAMWNHQTQAPTNVSGKTPEELTLARNSTDDQLFTKPPI
jgi:hypothetical protein